MPFQFLWSCTDGFADSHIVGRGAFGTVYKGFDTRPDALIPHFAVKRLKLGSDAESARRGERSCLQELAFLRQFQHEHIIPLLAYCFDINGRALVYELMVRGSLAQVLLDDHRARELPWVQRIRVAREVASALIFLQERGALHRDVKSANIGMTAAYSAKLLDCGLSKFLEDGKEGERPHDNCSLTVTGGVFGTPGYMCPRYRQTLRYGDLSEAYSFGIVLMELFLGQLQQPESAASIRKLCGRRQTDGNRWRARADARGGDWPGVDAGFRFVQLARHCTHCVISQDEVGEPVFDLSSRLSISAAMRQLTALETDLREQIEMVSEGGDGRGKGGGREARSEEEAEKTGSRDGRMKGKEMPIFPRVCVPSCPTAPTWEAEELATGEDKQEELSSNTILGNACEKLRQCPKFRCLIRIVKHISHARGTRFVFSDLTTMKTNAFQILVECLKREESEASGWQNEIPTFLLAPIIENGDDRNELLNKGEDAECCRVSENLPPSFMNLAKLCSCGEDSPRSFCSLLQDITSKFSNESPCSVESTCSAVKKLQGSPSSSSILSSSLRSLSSSPPSPLSSSSSSIVTTSNTTAKVPPTEPTLASTIAVAAANVVTDQGVSSIPATTNTITSAAAMNSKAAVISTTNTAAKFFRDQCQVTRSRLPAEACERLGRSLLVAAKKDEEKEVKDLCLRGANLHEKDDCFGGAPLHWARSPMTLTILLHSGANVHENIYTGTALHWAARRGTASGVRVLLSHGARVDVKNTCGKTPLDLAKKGNDGGMESEVYLLLLFSHAIRRAATVSS